MQSQNEPSAMKVAIEICEEFAEHWEQQARSGDNTGASDHRADAARQIIAELRNVNTAATPAQTAITDDARDSERLNWLLHNMSGKEMRRIGIETSGGGPLWGRVAIDAALSQHTGEKDD